MEQGGFGGAVPIKQGWMLKKGRIVKNWKRRYFVLYPDVLYYYSKPSDKHVKGMIILTGCTMSALNESDSNTTTAELATSSDGASSASSSSAIGIGGDASNLGHTSSTSYTGSNSISNSISSSGGGITGSLSSSGSSGDCNGFAIRTVTGRTYQLRIENKKELEAWLATIDQSLARPGAARRLLKAAADGELDTLRSLLLANVDVNVKDKETQRTAMHLACRNGQFDVVKELLSSGFNELDAVDISGWTALSLATKNRHGTIVDLLLESRALPHIPTLFGDALMIAVDMNDLQMVQVLVVCGHADVHTRDSDGSTPLHLSAASNSLYTLEYLISKGADCNAPDNAGRTPLQVVVEAEAERAMDAAPLPFELPAQRIGISASAERALATVMSCLLRHGADPTRRSKANVCCLDIATGRTLELLQQLQQEQQEQQEQQQLQQQQQQPRRRSHSFLGVPRAQAAQQQQQ